MQAWNSTPTIYLDITNLGFLQGRHSVGHTQDILRYQIQKVNKI